MSAKTNVGNEYYIQFGTTGTNGGVTKKYPLVYVQNDEKGSSSSSYDRLVAYIDDEDKRPFARTLTESVLFFVDRQPLLNLGSIAHAYLSEMQRGRGDARRNNNQLTFYRNLSKGEAMCELTPDNRVQSIILLVRRHWISKSVYSSYLVN